MYSEHTYGNKYTKWVAIFGTTIFRMCCCMNSSYTVLHKVHHSTRCMSICGNVIKFATNELPPKQQHFVFKLECSRGAEIVWYFITTSTPIIISKSVLNSPILKLNAHSAHDAFTQMLQTNKNHKTMKHNQFVFNLLILHRFIRNKIMLNLSNRCFVHVT